MSTQLKQLPDKPDWKDRYYQALNEFDEKEKKRSEEEGGLYKSILRLIFSYTGVNRNLDQQLTNMRDKLRQETGNRARNKIINPVIDSVVHLAQQRDTQQKSDSVDHLERTGSLVAQRGDRPSLAQSALLLYFSPYRLLRLHVPAGLCRNRCLCLH